MPFVQEPTAVASSWGQESENQLPSLDARSSGSGRHGRFSDVSRRFSAGRGGSGQVGTPSGCVRPGNNRLSCLPGFDDKCPEILFESTNKRNFMQTDGGTKPAVDHWNDGHSSFLAADQWTAVLLCL